MKEINLYELKNAALLLSSSSEKQRNLFLKYLSKTLINHRREIIKANKEDVYAAKICHLPQSFIERLMVSEIDIKKMILRLAEIEKLKSHLGEIMEKKIMKDGLRLEKVRAPLGVIFVIYEARPEVTIDVVSLCIKSANAVILKGGKEALNTNKILFNCILLAFQQSKLPQFAVNFIASPRRKIIGGLLKRNDCLDLVIARGGYGLVKAVLKASTIPVLAHAAGGARIYIDKSADLSTVNQIVINAKTSKPAACNSLDTVVIHKDIAKRTVPSFVAKLKSSGVKVIGDNIAGKLVKIGKAEKSDWDKEFLDLTLAIKIVDNIDEAIRFINKHSKRHSEGIIAAEKKIIDYFVGSIDSAAIFVNCSTRLHDGYIFGLGAEMGIATGKLHARGPVGLNELTTYKWIAKGNGQIRK